MRLFLILLGGFGHFIIFSSCFIGCFYFKRMEMLPLSIIPQVALGISYWTFLGDNSIKSKNGRKIYVSKNEENKRD